ncbi:tape measure protein [Fusibacter paucivorans]|uniref:Tape measure protein n=1 Tax=Fusibacter paucivorans TaxID=76009 RepID=A0ABS5PSG0_9FIRM|nr:tape measure protein [Fusibacter paucivorans]MBS7527847.1 tape measure protein [Fusibacter paucivorans]
MGTLENAIQLYDRMPVALSAIDASVSRVNNSFEAFNVMASNTAAVKSFQSTQLAIVDAEDSIYGMNTAVAIANDHYLEMSKVIIDLSNAQQRIGNFDASEAEAVDYTVAEMSEHFDDAAAKAKKLNEEQEAIKKQAEEARKLIKGLADAYLSFSDDIGIDLSVDNLVEMSDSFSTMRMKIDNMNDGLQSTDVLQDRILGAAENSRSSYEDTAAAVISLGDSAGDAFSGSDEIVTFAEQMNKQFKIGGATIEEQSSAIESLTQAMAAGSFDSSSMDTLLQTAPMLTQAIADSMGVGTDGLSELAASGAITAEVVKNAMFASASETNQRFAEIPATFSDVSSQISTRFATDMQPVFDLLSNGATFVSDHLSLLMPVFYGLAAAAGVLSAAMAIQAAMNALSATTFGALATAMLANPAVWYALIIGALVARLYSWIQANGGVEASLVLLKNTALNAWEFMGISIAILKDNIATNFENMLLAGKSFATGLANAFDLMAIKLALTFQGIVNNGIDMINALIDVVNLIPGVQIDAVEKVTFAAEIESEKMAQIEARNKDLEAYQSEIASNRQVRTQNIEKMRAEYESNKVERENQYNAAKAAHETTSVSEFESASDTASSYDAVAMQQMNDSSYDSRYTGEGVGSAYASPTSSYSDSASTSDEDLGYMRDLAEQDVINQFTTAEVKVDMANTFGDIRETADLDGVLSFFTDKLTEQLAVVAEGVY